MFHRPPVPQNTSQEAPGKDYWLQVNWLPVRITGWKRLLELQQVFSKDCVLTERPYSLVGISGAYLW